MWSVTGPKLLRKYLETTGQTQVDLARVTRLDQGMISRWVRGDRRPGLDNAELLERLTGGAVPATAWMKPRKGSKAA